mgnify:CR=1 FL=1
MAIDKNNKLFNEKVKDGNNLYYHLDEDTVKNKKQNETPKIIEKEGPKVVTVDELLKYDKSFNESMFITKVNNMFVKFFTDIMMDRLPEVNHFVSDEVYKYGENIINNVKKDGNRQMYDELNVKSTTIKKIEITEDSFIINVYLQSRYMDYIISLDDGDYVSGNNTSRKQEDYNLTLTKRRVTRDQSIVRKCPGCGAPINVNNSGKCEYCGSIYNQEDYDWVITSLEKLN